jgi:hypothetical protein
MTPDQIVLERMFRGVGCFFARCAHVSPGGRAVELDGIRAAVVPALPHASIVNCLGRAELWERRHGRAG